MKSRAAALLLALVACDGEHDAAAADAAAGAVGDAGDGPCEPRMGSNLCCVASAETAPCCEPPPLDPEHCETRRISDRQSQTTCQPKGGQIPYQESIDGRVWQYGDRSPGGALFECSPETGRILTVYKHAAGAGGRDCPVECWSRTGGARTPCPEDPGCGPDEFCAEGRCAGCPSNCEPDELRCARGGTQRCEVDATGCSVWSETRLCSAGNECQQAGCWAADCPILCEVNETRCAGPGAFVTCEVSEGCPRWVRWQACPEGEVCIAGECGPGVACADQCLDDETACLTEVQTQRCVRTALGCLDWAEAVDCAAGERCRDGACRTP